MTTEDRPEAAEFEDGPITWTDAPKVIRERDMAAAALDALEEPDA